MNIVDGSMVSSFEEIARMGKDNFQNLFREFSLSNIEYTMKVVKFFFGFSMLLQRVEWKVRS